MKISQIDETRLSTLGRGLRAMAHKRQFFESTSTFNFLRDLLLMIIFSWEKQSRDLIAVDVYVHYFLLLIEMYIDLS